LILSIFSRKKKKESEAVDRSSWVIFRRLMMVYIKPYAGSFILSMIFMALSSATTGGLAKSIEPVINGLGKTQTHAYVWGVGALITAIFFIRGTTNYLHGVILNRIGQKIITQIQQQLSAHLLKADLAYFHKNPSGTLMMRLLSDAYLMRQAVSDCLTNAFKGGATLLILIGIMFYQDWRLALVSFIIFPISATLIVYLGKHMRRYARKSQEEMGRFASLLSQIFLGIRHVKAYGMEDSEQERVKASTQIIYRLSVKSFRASALTGPIAEVLSGFAIMAVIVYGHWKVAEGALTTGALFSFITAFILAYEPLKKTARVNAMLQAGLAAAQRIFDVLDTPPQINDKEGAKALSVLDYSIALENLSFTYEDGTKALDCVTLTVPHGQMVAIVGASGAGKSTIINLIPRFYDIQSGRLTIGGQDIRDVTMESLRQNMAIVSQEPSLFDNSIHANIAYGRPSASRLEVQEAARHAFADQFIEKLPQGYDSIVGENGIKLSGGQRQRIAIARAMLRNAPILLLDEATSALDNESERAVQKALKSLQKGRTTLIVAHRLSTIVDADLIVVLEDGRVAESGRHAQLLALNGTYARLYEQDRAQKTLNEK